MKKKVFLSAEVLIQKTTFWILLNFTGEKDALKRYEQFALNTRFFWEVLVPDQINLEQKIFLLQITLDSNNFCTTVYFLHFSYV